MVPLPSRHPELVVVAGGLVVGDLLELALRFRVERELHLILEDRISTIVGIARDEGLELRQFGIGQACLVLPLRGPSHRRDAVVGPDALQVGTTVLCPRDFVRGVGAEEGAGGELRRLRGDRPGGQRDGCEKGSKRSHGHLHNQGSSRFMFSGLARASISSRSQSLRTVLDSPPPNWYQSSTEESTRCADRFSSE